MIWVKRKALVTEGSPKWAYGWHTLGIVYQAAHNPPEARDAFQHAITDDPKSYGSYLMLARIAIRSKDWQNAANAADALIKADPKQTYPEIYLHQAAARFKLKDLAGAEMAAQTAADKFQIARAELVLGKIAEAKATSTAPANTSTSTSGSIRMLTTSGKSSCLYRHSENPKLRITTPTWRSHREFRSGASPRRPQPVGISSEASISAA